MHFVQLDGTETADDLRETALNLSGRLARTRDQRVRAKVNEDIDRLLDIINALTHVAR